MKIQCDVCNKDEASVFCSADEAALCDGCDHRVHHANKLASKHVRFSLHLPSSKESPRCDICQERLAILFCQEDRAILCRECDIPIHKANEHTLKHNRFLLTGVKLSSSSSSCTAAVSSSSSNGSDHLATDSEMKSSVSNNCQFSNPSSNGDDKALLASSSKADHRDHNHCVSQENSVPTSSISEYLMETLPGWRVDDFLDPSSCLPHGFCKFSDHDLKSDWYPFPSEDLVICVPQAPNPTQSSHNFPLCLPQSSGVINGVFKGFEDGFTVPQISHPPLKKPRQF